MNVILSQLKIIGKQLIWKLWNLDSGSMENWNKFEDFIFLKTVVYGTYLVNLKQVSRSVKFESYGILKNLCFLLLKTAKLEKMCVTGV